MEGDGGDQSSCQCHSDGSQNRETLDLVHDRQVLPAIAIVQIDGTVQVAGDFGIDPADCLELLPDAADAAGQRYVDVVAFVAANVALRVHTVARDHQSP